MKKTPNNPNIKYLHYRSFNARGEPSAVGGLTVAYIETEDGTIRSAAALCRDARATGKGKSDNFNRKIGRRIAAGRLLADVNVDDFQGSRNEFELVTDTAVARTLGLYRRRKDTVVMQMDYLPEEAPAA